ncbi:MAG: hypothetical protein LUH58_09430 [Lachnospiraceae bacterium]|nr:hypothetical protein [Lachnospiraceae bacterium]
MNVSETELISGNFQIFVDIFGSGFPAADLSPVAGRPLLHCPEGRPAHRKAFCEGEEAALNSIRCAEIFSVFT